MAWRSWSCASAVSTDTSFLFGQRVVDAGVWSYVAVVVVARRHRRPRRRRRRRPRRRHRRRPCRPRFRNLHRQQQQQPQQQQQRVESHHQFTFRGGWEGAGWEERRTSLE